MPVCQQCGRAAGEHDRHIRFRLPDPVALPSEQEQAAGTWMSDDDPNQAVMMQVPDVGAFMRALLPVQLTGGYTVTFGVWVSIHPDDLQRAFRTWWAPEYEDLRLSGRVSNALPVCDVFRAPVSLRVVDSKATPYCVDSDDGTLSMVLTDEWDHELVLSRLTVGGTSDEVRQAATYGRGPGWVDFVAAGCGHRGLPGPDH